MGRLEGRLAELGLSLPAPMAPPPGVELPFALVRVSGERAYVSGHGPTDGAQRLFVGKVGRDLGLEQAQAAARATGLSILASLRSELGELDRVVRWVKALGLVNCAPGFNETPAVMNGACGSTFQSNPPRCGDRRPGCTRAPPWERRSCRSTFPWR